VPFKRIPVSEEKEIEAFLEKNPEYLEKDLMIIGRQTETSDGNYVDLMGLDKNGNVVIIELKKDNAARKVISQVIDYAAWAEGLTYEDLNSIAKVKHLPDHNNLWEKYQEWTNEIDPEFNQNQKLYVIGEKIDPRTEKLVRFLRNKGIDIYCIEINFNELDGNRIVEKRDVVAENNTPVRKGLTPITEEDHLARGDSSIQDLYKLLNEQILRLGDDITVNPVQNYIGFVRNGWVFLSVKIRKEFLRLTLQTKSGFEDPKNLTEQFHKNRENLRVMFLKNKEQLDDITSLIKQTYSVY